MEFLFDKNTQVTNLLLNLENFEFLCARGDEIPAKTGFRSGLCIGLHLDKNSFAFGVTCYSPLAIFLFGASSHNH